MIPSYPEMGVWQVDTSSWNSMRNILDAIEMIRGATDGRIAMLPFKLRLEPQEVQPEGTRKTIHVLKLIVPWSLEQLHEKLTSLPSGQRLSLPAADLEAPEDLFPEEPESKDVNGALNDKPRPDLWDQVREAIGEDTGLRSFGARFIARESGVSCGLRVFESSKCPAGVPAEVLEALMGELTGSR
jgi:hypothetical protein